VQALNLSDCQEKIKVLTSLCPEHPLACSFTFVGAADLTGELANRHYYELDVCSPERLTMAVSLHEALYLINIFSLHVWRPVMFRTV
jgi:hypothetical protein